MLTAFLLGLGAGILATPHCLGMCGGFPLYLSRSSTKGNALPRQVLFILGKTFTYVFLGVLASTIGVVLLKDTSVARFAPTLRIAAGLITLIFGLAMLGLKMPSIKPLQQIADAGMIRNIFGGIMSSSNPSAAFVLGLGVGFLPCPLPIGMLATAAVTHSIPFGVALMAGVGLGTAPGLLAVGMFGIGLDRKFAKVGMRAAGVLVVAVGLLTLGRAFGIIQKNNMVSKTLPACCGEHRNR